MLKKYSTTVSLGRNRYQTTIGIKQINFYNGHAWQLNSDTWIDSGIPARPHMIRDAPFMVSVTPDGLRRIHPTREDDVWFEMSGAKINQAGTWIVVQLGTPTSIINNRITWNRTNINAYMDMAGHYVKLSYLLKNGYLPPNNQFAYEVSTNGLTRQGSTLLKDGVPVMHMRSPVAYDHDNPEDTRQITHEITRIDGKWHVVFTLPSLAGMSKPVIDPTLSLQPDATAGKDTMIRNNLPNNNWGISTSLEINQYIYKCLIQYDVSPIPSTAIIDSSFPSFYYTTTTVDTMRLHQGLTIWFEGEKSNAVPGATDGSTWNHRNANTGGQVSWNAAGGQNGVDYASAYHSSGTPTSTGWEEFSDAKVDVQDWVDGSAVNYGWWKAGSAYDSCIWCSSDDLQSWRRPKLVTNWSEAKKADTPFQFFPILFDKKKH